MDKDSRGARRERKISHNKSFMFKHHSLDSDAARSDCKYGCGDRMREKEKVLNKTWTSVLPPFRLNIEWSKRKGKRQGKLKGKNIYVCFALFSSFAFLPSPVQL